MMMKTRIPFRILLLCSLLQCVLLAEGQNIPRHRRYELCSMSNEDMVGDIRIPVLFIAFTQAGNDNETRISDSNQKTWMTRLNDSHPINHMRANGSVNDYFLAQSYGQTNVTFERIGEYTTPGKASDYTKTSASSQMVRNALSSLQDVDWSRYDSNGDKEVDCLLVIYAGHCDGDLNTRGETISSIYPHMNWLSNTGNRTQLNLVDGYRAQRYVFAQSQTDHGTSLNAINTICHELSHGLFDLCDLYRNGMAYMGAYDPLCFGFTQKYYGSTANHCCDYSSFNRMYIGWLTPTILSGRQHITLRPLSQHAEACILFDPANTSHFFLLENRAKMSNSWDANIPEGGLLLTEVNFRRNAFESHYVNGDTPLNVQVINASTSTGLALTQTEYYDYNVDKTGVTYGPNGRSEIPAAVHSLFATHRITNITTNEDLSIDFDYEDQTDDIQALPEAEGYKPQATYIYNLSGQRLTTLQRGINIVGGRKVVEK